MANYLSLDEAARKLGINTDQLVDLRSQGEVRGFRDGSSWKFPDSEIERLKDQLPDLLASGLSLMGGGDAGGDDDSVISLDLVSAEGSSIDLGSDVNLIANEDASDIKLVTGGDSSGIGQDDDLISSKATNLSDSEFLLSGNDLLELDSAELKLSDPAILHDSSSMGIGDAANEPKPGLDADSDLELADAKPVDAKPLDDGAVGSSVEVAGSGLELAGSDLKLVDDDSDVSIDLSDIQLDGSSAGGSPSKSGGMSDGGLSGGGLDGLSLDDEDSGELIIGGDDGPADSLDDDLLGDLSGIDSGGAAGGREASSLELMSDLATPSEPVDMAGGSQGVDVLSELDLLSSAAGGSGLIGGDSDNLLGPSSGLGSSLADDALADSNLAGLDDALDDDDDLVIADDDDDLVISSAGSDISVAGDSGINLMSPADSGLSLESEPLDLAGSSISALDLGSELADGSGIGSGSGLSGIGLSGADLGGDLGGGGSGPDEEFQLAPSGLGLEADIDSASQVIEVEDSGDPVVDPVGEAAVAEDPFGEPAAADGDVFGEPVDDGGFGDGGFGGGFDEPAEAVAVADDDGGMGFDSSASPAGGPVAAGPVGYEVPFTLLQTLSLMLTLVVFSIGGILMTDLVRNMWTYTEPSAPVSSLTNWLIDSVGLGG